MWWADCLEHLLLFDPNHASQRDALQALLDATFSQNPQLQSAARRRIGYGRACWFYLSLDKNYQGRFYGFGLMSFPCFVTDSSQCEREWLLPHIVDFQNLTPDGGVTAISSLSEVRL